MVNDLMITYTIGVALTYFTLYRSKTLLWKFIGATLIMIETAAIGTIAALDTPIGFIVASVGILIWFKTLLFMLTNGTR